MIINRNRIWLAFGCMIFLALSACNPGAAEIFLTEEPGKVERLPVEEKRSPNLSLTLVPVPTPSPGTISTTRSTRLPEAIPSGESTTDAQRTELNPTSHLDLKERAAAPEPIISGSPTAEGSGAVVLTRDPAAAAVADLSARLNIPAGEISVISQMATEINAGQDCSLEKKSDEDKPLPYGITIGREIILEAESGQYRYLVEGLIPHYCGEN